MKGTREELERINAMLGHVLREELNDSTIGFVLILFDFGEGGLAFTDPPRNGFMTYVSNAQRPDVAKMLRELATKMEGDA